MEDIEKSEQEETNEEQAERIFHVLLESIPNNICYFNVLTALGQLVLEISMVLHEECHMGDDAEDEHPYGNLPGTPFSQN